MHTYYIDESGHGGDLATSTGTDFDFEGQPYFTLAAVGTVDLPKLEATVVSLRSRYRIPQGELKSKSLQSKPRFVAELLDLLIKEKCELFVEVVDKRFFVCIQIVNIILLRADRILEAPAQRGSGRILLPIGCATALRNMYKIDSLKRAGARA